MSLGADAVGCGMVVGVDDGRCVGWCVGRSMCVKDWSVEDVGCGWVWMPVGVDASDAEC